MIRRNGRTKHKIYFIVAFLGLIVLYNEFLAYDIQAFRWSVQKCADCVSVLLVADPQILGYKNENYKGSSWAIWDSDRYLKKTFSRAVDRVQPNVIVFLGDIMDEGHIASVEDFEKYKRRFSNIFDTPENTMKIYIPGDNDIGGEEDMVSSQIHERFNYAYTQPDTLVYSTTTFFKVNRLTKSIPPAPKEAFLNDYTERNTTNIVLSHLPLLFTPGSFVQNVLKELSPQIIFTAHDHKAMHMSLDTATDQLSDVWVLPPHQTPLYQLRLDMGDVHELQIPTCSYRMGTKNMGYGLAYIDTQEKTLDFTILWLPDRFKQLWLYLYSLAAALLISLVFIIFCTCTNSNATYSRVPI
ncbi:cell division control protein 1 [Trichogramma pretiosum]|uniref:cell division control protein 1 n=1 Tax=Trichogramma pretiosum TaxID=7493 RepID=UPI0006C9954B|nr:cell division control protein 1 [Trichogramma pretiosum]